MMSLRKVGEFVDENVFEAVLRLFCKLRVKANGTGARIAASPFGLHLLHVKLVKRDADDRRPCCYKRSNRRSDLFTIKLGNDGLYLIFACSRSDPQDHLANI